MSLVIVVDGTDASGKKTQSDILCRTLGGKYGLRVRELSFPDYGDPSSTLVRMYLGGEFGKHPNDTNAYAASSFFAVDRYASFVRYWKKDYEDEKTVIFLNRYTTANAVHQLAKLSDPADKSAFLDWLYDYEFVKLGLPVPDLVFYLEMPPEFSKRLLEKRCLETGANKDIHEADGAHLKAACDAAHFTARRWGWQVVPCVRDGVLRTREDIAAELEKSAVAKLREKGIL